MKFRSLLFFACCLLILSCNEADDDTLSTCFRNDPVAELPWLSAKVDEFGTGSLSEYFYVAQARFGFETVFIFGNCCPFCNSIYSVYNCNGEAIGYLGDGTFDWDIMSNAKLVYKPENFACSIG